MHLPFRAVSEPSLPGPKWHSLYTTFWPAYHSWFTSKGSSHRPDLDTSYAALSYYMPEMLPLFEHICNLVNADETTSRFFTGYQPPAYFNACSQAIFTAGGEPLLIRNYDYHVDLMEGVMLLSNWNGKRVMGITDCLLGLLDGINEDGLAISLTFGGRKKVGQGFGIPIILRYVLEFCRDVQDALEALTKVPTHMSYNIAVLDKKGNHHTLMLSPDQSPIISNNTFTTNHQHTMDWPEYAHFNRTYERSFFLEQLLNTPHLDAQRLISSFLHPPLYNTRFRVGFGTLYTAVYRPWEGSVNILWPKDSVKQYFHDYQEVDKPIEFLQSEEITHSTLSWKKVEQEYKQWVEPTSYDPYNEVILKETVADILIDALSNEDYEQDRIEEKTLKKKLIHRGQVSWGSIVDYWSKLEKKYWGRWWK